MNKMKVCWKFKVPILCTPSVCRNASPSVSLHSLLCHSSFQHQSLIFPLWMLHQIVLKDLLEKLKPTQLQKFLINVSIHQEVKKWKQ